METRQLDLKLLFDALASSNGQVKASTLSAGWPRESDGGSSLPPDLISCWMAEASADGQLSWRRFQKGVDKALTALARQRVREEPKKPSDNHWVVSSSEMEEFLRCCSQESVSQALIRSRKEVYKCHRSLSDLTSLRKCKITETQQQPVIRMTLPSPSADSNERGWSPDGQAEPRNTPKRSVSFNTGIRPASLVVSCEH